MSDEAKDPSRIRQALRQTEEQRSQHVEALLAERGPLIRGTYRLQGGRCGRPGCRCSRGQLHEKAMLYRREDGNYRIVGRSKELIIRGGENIYPPEVEEFLHHHPAVAEVAVAGLPDAKYGEVVAAWVVPKSGATLTPDELKCYCQGQIAHYKVPRYFKFVDAFPMTVTGKIQKFHMRQQSTEELGLQSAASIETA